MITYETTEQDGITYDSHDIGSTTFIRQHRKIKGSDYSEYRVIMVRPTSVWVPHWSIRASKEI